MAKERQAVRQIDDHVDPETPVCPITGDDTSRCLGTWFAEDVVRLWKEDIGIDVRSSLEGVTGVALWHAQRSDLQFFVPAATGARALYDQLHELPWYLQTDKWEFQEAARHISSTDCVLDLGAGREPFAAFVNPDQYVAADPFAGDQTKELSARKFDVVCAFQVLEHVADPVSFMRTVRSHLRPGGRAILGVPNRNSYLADLVDFALDMPPHHVSRWSKRALEALAQETGFHVEALTCSPLESWEVSLYWMSRLERKVSRTSVRRNRAIRILAYSAACVLTWLLPAPKTRGGTLLMRARVT